MGASKPYDEEKKRKKAKEKQEEIKKAMQGQITKVAATLFTDKDSKDNVKQDDLLRGGKDADGNDLVKISLEILYDHWQVSQKTTNIFEEKVAEYLKKIELNQPIRPILLESLELENNDPCIRTLDGRHRLIAAKKAGLKEIYVAMPDKLKTELLIVFPNIFVGVKRLGQV